ncbi:MULTISPECIES: glycogen/starch/alpha-glucan phosphorylase [unclassified Variovorax]|uniref:glycogen/starch/alpha-glucan phosphorylase n=1 Tax=Variovorax sp. dw_954 TaxID=2720078 RepID=UPI00210CB9C8|nr:MULTISPECIES: glycogen/starch/alpha-glucan phosphorylase [unclassified Variovorax]
MSDGTSPGGSQLGGANVEIREEVGDHNFFLFGLTAEEVARVKVELLHGPCGGGILGHIDKSTQTPLRRSS